MHGQRPYRHTSNPCRSLYCDRTHAVEQQLLSLIQIGTKNTTGKKATRVIDDNRHIPYLLHIVVGFAQRLFRCFFAENNLYYFHFVDRAKEVKPDKPTGIRTALRQQADRQCGCVGTVDTML